MNLENLECKTYKNYKELCSILNEDIKCGKSKQIQLDNWKRYFDYERNKNSYVITNIREIPIEKTDNRKNYNRPLPDDMYIKGGIYYIIDEFSNMYIGSTNNFGSRYYSHIRHDNKCESVMVTNNRHMFGVLYESKTEDRDLLYEIEKMYIEYFRDCTDFNLVNYMSKNYSYEVVNRPKYKNIKINEKEFDKAIKLLMRNGFDIENVLIGGRN